MGKYGQFCQILLLSLGNLATTTRATTTTTTHEHNKVKQSKAVYQLEQCVVACPPLNSLVVL